MESSAEIPLNVKPGTLSQADQETQAQSAAPGQSLSGVRVMDKDIRFIKTGKVRPWSTPFYRQPLFFLINLIPPLFAFVAFLVRRKSLMRVEKASEYRSKEAHRKARKEIAKARKLINTAGAAAFYEAIHAAVAGYLADKFGMSASGLLWDEVDRHLEGAKVGAAIRSEIRNIFDQADMARFATFSFSDEAREGALLRAERILDQLNGVL